MIGFPDLRAFCRPPMGVPVEFADVSTYPDGQAVCGLFDRPVQMVIGDRDLGRSESAEPQLRLPFNAFATMPQSRDLILITDAGLITEWRVNQPTAEADGAFLVYDLERTATPQVVQIAASADNGQSVASDVLDAIVARLGDGAWRTRFNDFAARELPADNVFPDMENEADAGFMSGTDEITFRFDVRHTVQAFDDAEKLGDARYIRGRKLITADLSLGGLVRRLRFLGRKWEMSNGESQTVACVASYEVEFSTIAGDPSTKAF